MIRVLGVMTVSEMAKRSNDLVVSPEDLKAMERRERVDAILKIQEIMRKHYNEVGTDVVLFQKIEELLNAYDEI